MNYSLTDELAKAFQNVSGKELQEGDTVGEMLHNFNALYTCVVTFTTTPDDALVVVKKGSTVIAPEEDGTFQLKEGAYTYTVSAPGYTSKVDQALTITNADETTGTKTVSVTALATCVVTFALTPDTATLEVLDSEGTALTAEGDGTYLMPAGEYTYSASNEGYVAVEDEALTISAGDESTGTKTVTVTLDSE